MDRTRRQLIRRLVALTSVASLVMFAAACGDDDEDSADATSTTADAPAGTSQPIEVTADDYAFTGLPERIEPGTERTLHNNSSSEAHELVAFDLPADEERSAEEIFELPEDQLGAFFQGDPNLVLVAEPNADAFVALGDGALTRPARYLIFCAIPIGADPAEYTRQARESNAAPPDVAGGPPHFTEGMLGELTVG